MKGYFEQRLIRRAFDYDPEHDKIDLASFEFPQCPNELLELTHNATYTTQICFQKDLFYNVEVILGRNKSMELSLDLTSPWTWFKSKSCLRCRKVNTLSFEEDTICKNNGQDCSNSEFNQTYDSPDWQDVEKTVKLYSDDQMVMGKFQTDKISFLAYNSSQRMFLGEYIAEKLGKHQRLDAIPVKGLRMMNVNRIYGVHKYLADGAIGLGFGYAESDSEDAEPDTDFLETLIKQDTSLVLTKQRFAIYCLEIGYYFQDYVVQFGGFDVKYAHEHSNDVVWLDRIPSSGYYWMVQMNAFGFRQLNNSTNTFKQDVTQKRAIFTLSSQFIELPLEELKFFLETMNSFSNTNTQCYLIDQELLMVYCKNLLFPQHFVDLKLLFHFQVGGSEQTIELASHLIYRNCTQNKEIANLQDCSLNIRYSKSDYFILGEPFIKWHYMIFDNEPGNNDLEKVGILPAATNMYYQEHPQPIFDSENWPLYKAVVYIFVIGVVLICCLANCKRGIKDLFRAFKHRKPAQYTENQSLRIRQNEDLDAPNDFEDDYKQARQQITQITEQREKKTIISQEAIDTFNAFANASQSETKNDITSIEDHSL